MRISSISLLSSRFSRFRFANVEMNALQQRKRGCCKRPVTVFWSVLFLVTLTGLDKISAATPAFVHGYSATPQTAQTTVPVTFAAAQTAGNLNVVIVGWSDATATVTSVKDSKGNNYLLAGTPVVLSSAGLSQSVYYAKNIAPAAANANTVTVTFGVAAAYPDVRILEYSGLDPSNPLDAVVGATGTSVASSSGTLTTGTAKDLLVGANTVRTLTTGAGANFTERLLTSPDGDIAEDRAVTATGSYSATAPLSPAGGWVMQMAAFRAAGSPTPTPTPKPTAAAPTYIQGAYGTPQSPVTTVAVAYPGAQVAGDLNVVIVGWSNTTAKVSSITDSKGNTYHLAVGPTLLNGALSQSIYYAPKITAGGTNTVTVKFSPAAAYPDVRILEYSGISSSNPLDGASGSTESIPLVSYGSSSGTVTTTNAVDLLVGANTVQTGTTAAGPSFTSRMITSPDLDIAEDRVVYAAGSFSATAPVTGSQGFVMQLAAFRAASNPSDTTPPTVTISSPKSGATLTGKVAVTVVASDTGTGVAAVQLQLDGMAFGTADTASPYVFSLNTANFANGSHRLTATAWDQANNSATSSALSVTFSNSSPRNPAQSGVWSGTVPLPMVTVNSVLLPAGKVLFWGGQTDGFDAIVWNPVLNTIESAPVPANTFCTGNEQMADGRIMVVGGHIAGHVGLPAANIFNPANESWTVAPDMTYPRWYPTATTLSDGRIIVTSGETDCDECDATVQEIYNPSTNSWSQLSSAPFFFPYYPNVYQLPDGRVFVPSDGEKPIVSEVLDLNAHTWTSVGGAAVDGGSSVMYLPNKFLKIATSVDPDLATRPSVATGYILDLTQTSPAWTRISSMAFPRTYQNTTLLPDGTVLVTGGGTTTDAVGLSDAVLPAELWSPSTRNWTALAPMSAPRLYHSEALLLPDGRVLISGGGSFNGVDEPTDQDSAEFFSPPYLFKGPRPVITAAPAKIAYGQNFTVQTSNAAQIASVSLIRFGAVTHCTNMGQRFLPLSFSAGSSSLTVKAPATSDLAPPGNYLLFIVTASGVPSVAPIVHF